MYCESLDRGAQVCTVSLLVAQYRTLDSNPLSTTEFSTLPWKYFMERLIRDSNHL